MTNIKFVDLNSNLVKMVSELGIESICSDYFLEAYKTPRPVLMTASNPRFTFGGGLDYIFTEHFPKLCQFKQIKGGEEERIANICFCITVGDDYKANKEIVKNAIQFAIDNTDENETLILSGVGTCIGGMSNDEFIKILKEIL